MKTERNNAVETHPLVKAAREKEIKRQLKNEIENLVRWEILLTGRTLVDPLAQGNIDRAKARIEKILSLKIN
jgi:hypothetical protein